jgi:hypothetical protein
VWYGGVEGGLRAKVLGRLGWRPSPNQERVLYPARRSPFIEPGLSGSGLYTALGLPWVALCPPLGARPSLCTLEALRGTLSGATMTIPGGSGTLWATSSPCSAHRLLSYGRSSHVTGLRPSLLQNVTAPVAEVVSQHKGMQQTIGLFEQTFLVAVADSWGWGMQHNRETILEGRRADVAVANSWHRGMQGGKADTVSVLAKVAGVVSWPSPTPTP